MILPTPSLTPHTRASGLNRFDLSRGPRCPPESLRELAPIKEYSLRRINLPERMAGVTPYRPVCERTGRGRC